jgi:hypothetical protein|tara:strand:- start:1468 stop:3093 length:1626 start_codon:yes stop_codon:yes gene_type:complete
MIDLKLTKRSLLLLLLVALNNNLNTQVWNRSFTAGNYDSNSKLLGGSEVLQLIGHKKMLFASIGYWEDGNNIWYGGSNNSIGWGQINRLDNPNANWQEDLFLGANYLRPEILKQVIFTKDKLGNLLPKPDTVLISAGYSPNYFTRKVNVTSFVRNDLNGTWGESLIINGGFPAGGDNYSIRDLQIHNDKQTGLEYIFATIGTKGIFKGQYNPLVTGKIDWLPLPEYGPITVRSLGIEIANDTLYFSSGDKLYKRVDGLIPSYTVAHNFGDLGASINSAVGGIRGLTTIKNPNGSNEALLLMWCPNGQSSGIIYRLEPNGLGGFNRIYETTISVLVENYLPGSTAKYILGAYNEFYQYIDPLTSDTLHLVGFEANVIGGGHLTWNGYYKGGLFATRNATMQYSIGEINGSIGLNDSALVANRCYVTSPFPNENALYYGGFDPNSNSSTNKAWIFKNDFQLTAISELSKQENKYAVYPNPTQNNLFIENTKSECYHYEIISLTGKVISTDESCMDKQIIDVSNLPPNLYIIRIGEELFKFIKM